MRHVQANVVRANEVHLPVMNRIRNQRPRGGSCAPIRAAINKRRRMVFAHDTTKKSLVQVHAVANTRAVTDIKRKRASTDLITEKSLVQMRTVAAMRGAPNLLGMGMKGSVSGITKKITK